MVNLRYLSLPFIEGSTVKNVIDKLVANGKGTRENYMKAFKEIDFPYPTPEGNFEGYLYPETLFYTGIL